MTTYPFTPNRNAPFQFQPTLDGQQYNAIVTWNVFGRRYYVSITQINGTAVLTRPVIGSPIDYDISIVAGYFDSKMVYRQASAAFEVTP